MEIKNLISILAFICCLIGCATRVEITPKKIFSSEKFDDGVFIHKISVDSFNAAGKPVKYRKDSVFHADDLRSLPDSDILKLLSTDMQIRYTALLVLHDSLSKKELMKDHPADTVRTPGGLILQRTAGRSHPLSWYDVNEQMNLIRLQHIRFKPGKTIYLNRSNKNYRWFARKDQSSPSKPVSNIYLLPGQWYMVELEFRFGLLSTGYCNFYFRRLSKNKVEIIREDHENLGPF